MEKGKNFSLNEIEDFGIVEVSTKKSTGKKRNDYVVSRTEAKKTGTKKTLSVVEDYARFDFRANKKAVKSVQEEAATQKKECKCA